MSFWINFLAEVARKEKSEYTKRPKIKHEKAQYMDFKDFFKLLCSWGVSGIISLIPIITHAFYISKCRKSMDLLNVIKLIFGNQDVFLIITTLSAGVTIELMYSNKNTSLKYLIASFNIILIVLGIHIYSMLQYGMLLPSTYFVGILLVCACVFVSLSGYTLICMRETKKYGN